MTSSFEGQPPQNKAFSNKTRVIWVLGSLRQGHFPDLDFYHLHTNQIFAFQSSRENGGGKTPGMEGP